MSPAIKDGDLCTAVRGLKHERNDIVLYKGENGIQIGRSAAEENDVVEVKEDGLLYVNHIPQKGYEGLPVYAETTMNTGCSLLVNDYKKILMEVPDGKIIGRLVLVIRRRGF